MAWTRSAFTPLVLLVEDQEWTARSFESILTPHGCGVFKAYTGAQALEVVRRLVPDLVLVDRRLPDMTGVQVLKQLRKVDTVYPSTPRALISTSPVGPDERVASLEEGAWDVLVPPFDAAELILRFDTWISAKRDAEHARERGLVDPLTGFYNFKGLLRRLQEEAAEASRHDRHIAVVALGTRERPADAASGSEMRAGAETPAGEEPSGDSPEELASQLGVALKHAARLSDAIARVSRDEFVIVAPGTDREGAERMARRILDATSGARLPLRAGVYSARRKRDEPIQALDIVNRATSALRRAQARDEDSPIFTEDMLN